MPPLNWVFECKKWDEWSERAISIVCNRRWERGTAKRGAIIGCGDTDQLLEWGKQVVCKWLQIYVNEQMCKWTESSEFLDESGAEASLVKSTVRHGDGCWMELWFQSGWCHGKWHPVYGGVFFCVFEQSVYMKICYHKGSQCWIWARWAECCCGFLKSLLSSQMQRHSTLGKCPLKIMNLVLLVFKVKQRLEEERRVSYSIEML